MALEAKVPATVHAIITTTATELEVAVVVAGIVMRVVVMDVGVVDVIVMVDVDVRVIVIDVSQAAPVAVAPAPAVAPVAEGGPHVDPRGQLPYAVSPAVPHQYCRVAWLDVRGLRVDGAHVIGGVAHVVPGQGFACDASWNRKFKCLTCLSREEKLDLFGIRQS